jgi:hypothetical protein
MIKLYHTEVFVPNWAKQLEGKTFNLSYSNHAKRACIDDRYGAILPPLKVQVKMNELIEIEANGQQAQ